MKTILAALLLCATSLLNAQSTKQVHRINTSYNH
jgi:hypothetical protein